MRMNISCVLFSIFFISFVRPSFNLSSLTLILYPFIFFHHHPNSIKAHYRKNAAKKSSFKFTECCVCCHSLLITEKKKFLSKKHQKEKKKNNKRNPKERHNNINFTLKDVYEMLTLQHIGNRGNEREIGEMKVMFIACEYLS